MTWEFFNTGHRSASFNMAFDRHLAAQLLAGSTGPSFRVYGWSPHAVSIGRHQSMDDFDIRELEAAGIDIVRRPTGGRAIFHANELTYSVAVPCGDRSLREIYELINLGLLDGLCNLGIRAGLTATGSDFRRAYEDLSGVACFATSAKSEIHVGGKKLIGSAQRRWGMVVLQHGSFLLDAQHRRLPQFLSRHHRSSAESLHRLLEESTIDARSILGREVRFSEAVDAMKKGCAKAWGIQFIEKEGLAEEEGELLTLSEPF